MNRLCIAFGCMLVSLCVLSNSVHAQVATEFSAGITAGASPNFITKGPDGNLWFTEFNGHRIGRSTPSGVVTEFSAGITGAANPNTIVTGSDGNLWFTEYTGHRIGRITITGVITEYSAGITPNAFPYGIAAGPDGNLWFVESGIDRIGRIDPLTGVVTEFGTGITAGAGLRQITAGPDGNLWFTEEVGNRIGRITPSGVITEFSAGISPGAGPFGITAGPDGNLWFTETSGNRIGRITPQGVVTEFSGGSSPLGITAGPDGNLWFADQSLARVVRITPQGVFTPFSTGITGVTQYITSGPDGKIWFTEYFGNRIGSMTVPPAMQSAVSRRVHGGVVTFDLPLSLVSTAPTTEPRQSATSTMVMSFNVAIISADVAVTEGIATVGALTFSGNDVIVPLTGVADQQYVKISLTNVASSDGSSGGSGSVRLGFLVGDVTQNRVVTVSDLAQVNAQLAQPVTAANYLKDVNASGTLSVADKGFTNANLAKALPVP